MGVKSVKAIRVLAIDGGGIRGIIPAIILTRVEQLLRYYSGNENAHISDYFDLIAGTSTGGILTSLYLGPDFKGSTRSKYSAKEILSLYETEGPRIFKKTLLNNLKGGFGLYGPKYSAQNLEGLLKDYLGEMRLEDLVKPCLIPAYEITRGQAIFFNQMNAYRDPKTNFLIREIVRGTTAAPTYFSVANIGSDIDNPLALIDGGMFANNPALCAYIEVCKFPCQPSQKDIMILSLGTGAKEISYDYDESKHWGDIQWAIPVIQIYGSAASQTVNHQLEMLYQFKGLRDQYLRIEPELATHHVNHKMDDVSPENIAALSKLGQFLVKKYDQQLRDFTRKLVVEELGRVKNEVYRMDF